jgi:hypothetical protein
VAAAAPAAEVVAVAAAVSSPLISPAAEAVVAADLAVPGEAPEVAVAVVEPADPTPARRAAPQAKRTPSPD